MSFMCVTVSFFGPGEKGVGERRGEGGLGEGRRWKKKGEGRREKKEVEGDIRLEGS